MIIILYVPNNKGPHYMEQILTELKEELQYVTFSKTSKQKINKEIENLSNKIN